MLAFADRVGKIEVLKIPPGLYEDVRVSPDGKQLAFTIGDEISRIGIYDLSGNTSVRRLTLPGSSNRPRWSPDGRQIAFLGSTEGKNGIFLQNSDGTGTPERLTTALPSELHVPWAWSPDGKTLAYTLCKNFTGCGIYTVALGGEHKVQTVADVAYNAAFSPDGRWVAYTSSGGGSIGGNVSGFNNSHPERGTKYLENRLKRLSGRLMARSSFIIRPTMGNW